MNVTVLLISLAFVIMISLILALYYTLNAKTRNKLIFYIIIDIILLIFVIICLVFIKKVDQIERSYRYEPINYIDNSVN